MHLGRTIGYSVQRASPNIIFLSAEIGSGSMMWSGTCGTCSHAMTSLRPLLSKLSGDGCEHLTVQVALPTAVHCY